jgi:mRNA interferase MazF
MPNRSKSKRTEEEHIPHQSGDTVLVNLDPTVGGEIKKTRPCLVLQSGGQHFDLIIVLPITDGSGKNTAQIYVPILDLELAGLTKHSVVDCFQIRAISQQRVIKHLGRVEDETLNDIRSCIAKILDIGEEHLV